MNQTLLKTKHCCELSVAKKIYFLLLALCIAPGGFAASCIAVKQVKTDYKNKKVTVAITWTGCGGDASSHRNTAWVFVDYRTVTNGVKSTTWNRATISAASAGTVVNSGNSKGVWIYGANNTTQTVTLTLSSIPAKYDWCAFATDYPPNAAYNGNNYTLRGTPPFLINGSLTSNNKTYNSACILSLTDATGRPGIVPPALGINIAASESIVCSGEIMNLTATASGGTTTAMTYTWNIQNYPAVNTTTRTYTTGRLNDAAANTYSVSVKNSVGCTATSAVRTSKANTVYNDCTVLYACRDLPNNTYGSLSIANNACATMFGTGWRMPTRAELSCGWSRLAPNASFSRYWYITSDPYACGYHGCYSGSCDSVVSCTSCSPFGSSDSTCGYAGYRCVRSK